MHNPHLVRLTTETTPTLRECVGVDASTAAEMLHRLRRQPRPDSLGNRLRKTLLGSFSFPCAYLVAQAVAAANTRSAKTLRTASRPRTCSTIG